MGLDDLTIMRSTGWCRAVMINSRAGRPIQIKNMYSALIRASANPGRVAVKCDAVDLSSIDASPELVQELTGAGIKYPDQRAFVRGGRALCSISVGD